MSGVLRATGSHLVYVDGVAYRVHMGQTADPASPVVAANPDKWEPFEVDYPAVVPTPADTDDAPAPKPKAKPAAKKAAQG